MTILSLLQMTSTKGMEYFIAIVFLVVFLFFLTLFKAPGESRQ